MPKNKFALPTMTFPYKIPNRLNIMSLPRKHPEDSAKLPEFTPTGVRKSALRACISDRVNECAWPYVRRLVQLRQMYKNKFPHSRLAKIDRMIAAANSTAYSKLSNSVISYKRVLTNDERSKKSRKWNESDWKKHMDYIEKIANPKSLREPEPVSRGPRIPMEEMQRRIEILAQVSPNKMYQRPSQDEWYKNPFKVPKSALTHVTTEREKILAKPKVNVPAA